VNEREQAVNEREQAVNERESVKAHHIRWLKGGEALVIAVTAQGIVLRSTVPSPPGSRIDGTLVGEPHATVRVKVHTCRRQPDGAFVLEGRPLDLTRDTRERLDALTR
jgi:hypothetical protein